MDDDDVIFHHPALRGTNSSSQTREVMEQVKYLKAQNSELEAQERELDNQKACLEENIRLLSHDAISRTYPLMYLKTRLFLERTDKKIHQYATNVNVF